MITDGMRNRTFWLEITMFWKLAMFPSSGEIIKPIWKCRLVPSIGTVGVDFTLSRLQKCFHYGV
jgi:hypothetical protein